MTTSNLHHIRDSYRDISPDDRLEFSFQETVRQVWRSVTSRLLVMRAVDLVLPNRLTQVLSASGMTYPPATSVKIEMN